MRPRTRLSTRTLFFAAAFAFAGVPAAQAQDPAQEQAAAPLTAAELEGALAGLEAAEGAAYVAARDALLARPGLAAALSSRPATWSEGSWRRDALAEVLSARLADPAPFEAIYALQGLTPSHYTARRRPGPEVLRELKRMATSGAPALLEVALKTFDVYPFSAADAFPAHLDAAAIEAFQQAERRALREGLMVAIGRSRHAAASHVLAGVLGDAREELGARQAAAIGLGRTGQDGALAHLVRVAADDDAQVEVRVACFAGAGSLRSAEALALIESGTASEQPEAVRRAAVAALGTFGSSWAWEGQAGGDVLRERATQRLVEVLEADAEHEALRQLAIQSLVTVAHPTAVELLSALEDQDRPAAVRAAAAEARTRLERSALGR